MQTITKLEKGLKSYFYSFIFPFTQKDCLQKMWIFVVITYIPFLNLLILRGWRFEFVHRLGWHVERPLPKATDIVKFLVNGLVLWMITLAYLAIPVMLIAIFGLGGWGDFFRDIKYLVELTFDYIWSAQMTTELYIRTLWSFIKNEFVDGLLAFAIENIYLAVYIPYYRVAMIRSAVTKNVFSSHFAVIKNLTFIFRNFLSIAMVYLFILFEGLVAIGVTIFFTMTVVLAPVIPVFLFYMYYWSTGYEYGHLAELMIAQEKIANKTDKVLVPQ